MTLVFSGTCEENVRSIDSLTPGVNQQGQGYIAVSEKETAAPMNKPSERQFLNR